MGNLDEERAALKNVYPTSRKWARKVNLMSDERVLEIIRLLEDQKKDLRNTA